MRPRLRPAAAAAGLLASLAFAGTALAAGPANLVCNSATPYTGGTYASLIVPPNGSCDISDATILGGAFVANGGSLTLDYSDTPATVGGSVSVGSGGTLLENPDWVVGGSVRLAGANTVYIYDSTTHGFFSQATQDIYFDQATIDGPLIANDTSDFGEIDDSTITGSVVVNHTTGASGFYVQGFGPLQDIGGSLYLTNNQAPTYYGGNHIHQNLVCAGNTPPPAPLGLPNQVDGRTVGQCAGSAQTSS